MTHLTARPGVASLLSWVLTAPMLFGCGTSDGSNGRGTTGDMPLGAAGAGAGADGAAYDNAGSAQPAALTPNTQAPGSGACVAGHYVGQFTGDYRSAAWGNGTTPLLVEAAEVMGMPGLEFWLEAVDAPCDADQEFCFDFKVTGGKIRGFANPTMEGFPEVPDNPLAVKVPFEIDLNGDLDCTQGVFEGQLENGWYDFGGTKYLFAGSIQSSYDAATVSFTDGIWAVTEQAGNGALLPPDMAIGGEGSWDATLQP